MGLANCQDLSQVVGGGGGEFVAKWVNADLVGPSQTNLCTSTQAAEEAAEVSARKLAVDAKLLLICMQNFRIVEGRSHKTAMTIRPGPEVATLAARARPDRESRARTFCS